MADATKNEDTEKVTYTITDLVEGSSLFIDIEKRDDGQLHYHVHYTIPNPEQTWDEMVVGLDAELGV